MKRLAPFVVIAALYGAALGRDAVDRWVAQTDLPPLVVETSAEVLDRSGALLRAFTVADGRWRMAAGAVDPAFVRALITYEDKRFWTHPGVDVYAVARAAWQSVLVGRIVSGGSTLTMQVSRLLEESGTGQWDGKLRQMRVALALEQRLSKEQILDLYLHLAPYGGNIEGLRAASLAYFGKEAKRLTPAQIALLVALPQSPEARRPDRHPQAARAARDRVLNILVQREAISDERALAAKSEPVPFARRAFPARAPHLTARLYNEQPEGGQITTTLNGPLQTKLETLAAQSVRDQGARMSVAIMVADHQTGEILASVGSAHYAQDQRAGFIDMTRAIRSPGSTLKPLIYGMAFDQGLGHPETLIADRPTNFDGYAPQNFDGQFRGDVRLRDALMMSLNLPVVALTEAIGPHRVMASLRKTGAAPVVEGAPGLAVALGGVGVTLDGLMHLYAGIARGGEAITLHNTPGAGPPRGRILAPSAAWQVSHILSQIQPPAGHTGAGIAYKTGTSYGHRDAWALGYDGQHVVGVWMGRPDGTPVPGVFGADLAAPLLFKAFGRIDGLRVPQSAPPPDTLMVSTQNLPAPLRRFGTQAADEMLDLVFPPAGAIFDEDTITAKVRDGVGPFTWLANGQPVGRSRVGQITLAGLGQGFVTLAVIDARGQSQRAQIRILAD